MDAQVEFAPENHAPRIQARGRTTKRSIRLLVRAAAVEDVAIGAPEPVEAGTAAKDVTYFVVNYVIRIQHRHAVGARADRDAGPRLSPIVR